MHNGARSDRRWVVLGEDGRFVTLGRAIDPSEDEVDRAEKALRAAGIAGWLAVMSGSPHSTQVPEVMAVRPLANPVGTFEAAVGAFQRKRASIGRR